MHYLKIYAKNMYIKLNLHTVSPYSHRCSDNAVAQQRHSTNRAVHDGANAAGDKGCRILLNNGAIPNINWITLLLVYTIIKEPQDGNYNGASLTHLGHTIETLQIFMHSGLP